MSPKSRLRISAGRHGPLAGLLLAALACEGPNVHGGAVVAQSGGRDIASHEVEALYQNRRAELSCLPLDDAALDALWAASLDDAIVASLFDQAARREHVAVLAAEVDGALARFRAASNLPISAEDAASPADEAGQTVTEAKAAGPRPPPAEGSAAAEPPAPPPPPPLPAASEAVLRQSLGRRLLLGKWMAQEVTARVYVGDEELERALADNPSLLQRGGRVRLRMVTLLEAENADAATTRRQLERWVATGAALLPPDGHVPNLPAVVRDLGWLSLEHLPKAVQSAVALLPLHRLSRPIDFGAGTMQVWVVGREPWQSESPQVAKTRLRRQLEGQQEEAAEARALAALQSAGQVELYSPTRPGSHGRPEVHHAKP